MNLTQAYYTHCPSLFIPCYTGILLEFYKEKSLAKLCPSFVLLINLDLEVLFKVTNLRSQIVQWSINTLNKWKVQINQNAT